MKKISKREKGILVAVILAVLYAAYTYLFSAAGRSVSQSETDGNEARGLVLGIAQSLARHQLTDAEQTVLEKVQAPWPAQPFLLDDVSSAEADAAAVGAQEVVPETVRYTGYVEIGAMRLAVINGNEYEVGDRLADSPYTVRGISSGQVLLGDATNRTVAVPMEDGLTPAAAQQTQQDTQ